MNALINYLDKYHAQLTVLLLGLSLIVLAVFIWVWFYNRKKYNHLKHQIPASVVKNYLDSIIQNSTALKSSLFRGGGLDVDGEGVPSVMPLSDLPGGAQAGVFEGRTGGGQDDSALSAEVSRLQAQLNEKESAIKDLENQNAHLGGDNKAKQERIEELEKLLEQAKAAGGEGAGADPDATGKIAALQEERDRLEEDLKQYEVISDDLADLKRLKQENAQLKKALEESGGQAPATEPEQAPEAAAEEAAKEPAEEPEQAPEEPAAEAAPEQAPEAAQPEEEDDEAAMAAAEESAPAEESPAEESAPAEETPQAASSEDSGDKDDEESKSPEDLLSEFEKMLG